MKKIFSLLLFALLAISCSKDADTPAPTPNPKFTLTIAAGNGGSVSSNGGSYEQGSTVSVTATAASGYRFVGWSNGETSATLNIVVTGDISITANFERITYSVEVSGAITKGSFLTGSTLTFYELNNALSQTGKSYNTDITDDFGSFNLNIEELTEDYSRVVGEGFYWNEVTDETTEVKMSLNAIAEIKEDINVNILTHLEYQRVIELVMNQGKSFAEAKAQALTEVLSSLGIEITSNFGTSENYNFKDGDEASKILLVASVVIQADRTTAEVTSLIATVANDLKDNGIIDNADIKREIAIPLAKLDLEQVASNVYNRYLAQSPGLTLNDYLSEYLDAVRIEYQQYLPDQDGDGIQDDLDFCPDTPSSDEADANGCGKSQKQYDLTISIEGNGVVSEEVVVQTGTTYDYGTTIKLTAIPEPGWELVGWSGALTGNENPITITIEEETLVGATFEKLDTDGDGVYDLEDQCPSTPEGFNVNSNGCHEFLFLADNGVTIIAGDGAFPGDIGYIDGEIYTVVDRTMLDEIIAQNGDVTKIITSLITDMSFLSFKEDFNQDISSWDVSNVTNMQNMFYKAKYFNQDISSWDVSNVTNMQGLFFGAHSFNQPIGSWDVSNVNNFATMFFSAINFNQDISSWDVSNATEMALMFGGAINFNQPISSWDVSNVIGFTAMFLNAWEFNQDISSWDTSNALYMANVFQNAFAFNQPIGSWDTSKVVYLAGMFENAISFNQDLSNWDFSSVDPNPSSGGLDRMFFGAIAFNQDIGNWDVSNITRMSATFKNAISFNQDLSNWDVSNVTNMTHMFMNAWDFNRDIGNWDVLKVTEMSGMFGAVTETTWTEWEGVIRGFTYVDSGPIFPPPFYEERVIQIPFGQMSFNQDLSGWCVPDISLGSDDFSGNGILTEDNMPVWGTCPSDHNSGGSGGSGSGSTGG